MQRTAYGAYTLTPLHHTSTHLIHKVHYQFLHMPFGLKMSQDVFQIQMDQIINSLLGIRPIHNDTCKYGRNPTEYDQHLLQVKKTTSQQGSLFSTEVSIVSTNPNFLLWSHIYCPWHEAIFHKSSSSPRPSPSPNLSFSGLINYLQPFLPYIASKTTFLHEQVTQWD